MSVKDDVVVGGLALVAAYLLYKKAQENIGAPVRNFVQWATSAPQADDPDTERDESNTLLGALGFKPFNDDPNTPRDESKLGFWAYIEYAIERFLSMSDIREGFEEHENCEGDDDC